MVLLLWLLTIAGFYFWIHQLQKRIENLEHPSTKETFTSGSLNATETTETVEDDGIDRSKWPEHLKTAATKSTPKVVSKTATKGAFDLEHFLGQKLFPILGATSIVIAIGFFAVWAFANGWVGPMGRIALGLMVSLALIGLGEWLKTKYQTA